MTRRLLTALLVFAGAAAMTISSSAEGARTHSLVFYAKATRVQFVNHADDRARGVKLNPFNIDTKLPTPKNANTGKKGARAGDNALFTFKLYSDASLTKSVGSAVYSCTFNFAQQAICEANFLLNDGTMIGSGPAALDTGRFTLAVIGGTGAYLGARGQLTTTPAATKNIHRVDIDLLASPR